MPRPPTPFPQRLLKKTEDDKYRCFITMLKHLSINFPMVEALERMPGYDKFMKDQVTKKRSITFKDDDRTQHCSAIFIRSLVQRKKIRVRSQFLVQSGHYILRKHYVICGQAYISCPSKFTRSWVWVTQSPLRCGY